MFDRRIAVKHGAFTWHEERHGTARWIFTPAALNKFVADHLAQPIDMVLHCPKCGLQHIDAPEPGNWSFEVGGKQQRQTWDNPPHKSHLCHGCGHIWRPADVPTNGVLAVKTRGKNDCV